MGISIEIESVRERLVQELPAELMAHSERVAKYAQELAQRFGYEDDERIELAGLLHDNCKHYGREELLALAQRVGYEPDTYELAAPEVLHAPLGARRLWRDFAIVDREVMLAVAGHTTGGRNLGKLGRIIYCADKLEPARDFPSADHLRSLAERSSLREFCVAVVAANLDYLSANHRVIHPASLEFYNELAGKSSHA
ncbi:MAG: hypothetical protein B1H03_04995 [Planctomycetales bacterium 4484_113]|nr:MAG: hypothetical protein B1H03_04995 [Planctomycetales bacterium 4484_113]